MKTLYSLALTTTLLFACGVVCAAQGGEGDNTGCNGVGNPNSPCEGSGGTTPGGGNFWSGDILSSAASASVASASSQGGTAYGGAGGTGGTGGAAIASTGPSYAASGISNSSVSISNPANSNVRYSGKVSVRNTPDVYSAAPDPTAPCIVGYGAGFSNPGLGISLGGGIKDDTCSALEIRRVAGDNELIRNLADRYLIDELNSLIDKKERRGYAKTSGNPFGY